MFTLHPLRILLREPSRCALLRAATLFGPVNFVPERLQLLVQANGVIGGTVTEVG